MNEPKVFRYRFVRVPLLLLPSNETGNWLANTNNDHRHHIIPPVAELRLVRRPSHDYSIVQTQRLRQNRKRQFWAKVRRNVGIVATVVTILIALFFLFLRLNRDVPFWTNLYKDTKIQCCKTVTCSDEIEGGFNGEFSEFSSVENEGECGLRVVPPMDMALISGGSEISPNSWPWQVYMIQDNIGSRGRTKFCGGVIVDSSFVLTAAHCFQPCYEKHAGRLANTLSIYVPVQSYTAKTAKTLFHKFRVCDVYMHDDFNPLTLSDDIALLRMCEPMNAARVCLPNDSISNSEESRGAAIVVGWGSGGESVLSQLPLQRPLRQLKTFLQDPSVCSHFFRSYFDQQAQLCAKSPGFQAPCQGDSGGPLLFEKNGRWTVHGIVSYGFGCGSNYHPDVYTSVSAYKTWIDKILRKETNRVFVK